MVNKKEIANCICQTHNCNCDMCKKGNCNKDIYKNELCFDCWKQQEPMTKTKEKIKIEKYKIEVAFTGKQISVQRENIKIIANIDSKHIEIENNAGDNDFVFRSKNSAETVKKWEAVIGCLQVLVKEIKSGRKAVLN